MATGTGVILGWFPMLRADKNFTVTSPSSRDYNCIAWALGYNNKWVWPVVKEERGDDMLWSNELGYSLNIENFIQFFEQYGFQICDSFELEQGYTKVVLYSIKGECKHAARQLPNGLWTSKLGPWNDIQHSTPYSLEGDIYGKVTCVLKKKR